jgi:guanidinoacetate N-methyltransferase
MTRRIKRLHDFDVSLQVKNDSFIRPPRDSQRNWLLNKAVTEFVQNLNALDEIAARFVPGLDGGLLSGDRTQAELTDEEIMEDWQQPMMAAMADIVAENHGDVLEIGFGRGVSSSMIQDRGVRSHTIIECNDSIVGRFDEWRTDYPGRDIRMVHGLWQDVLDDLGKFDGIFFHTYPLNESEFVEQIGESTTFADHFFPHAAAHLVDGGIFTYLSNEVDSLSRQHQRLLFRHFRSIEIRIVDSLQIPGDVRDAWWSDSMATVKALR